MREAVAVGRDHRQIAGRALDELRGVAVVDCPPTGVERDPGAGLQELAQLVHLHALVARREEHGFD